MWRVRQVEGNFRRNQTQDVLELPPRRQDTCRDKVLTELLLQSNAGTGKERFQEGKHAVCYYGRERGTDQLTAPHLAQTEGAIMLENPE